MKKFMLCMISFLACGKAMAMDKSLETLKNEIDARAQAWGSRYASESIYSRVFQVIIMRTIGIAFDTYAPETAEQRIAEFQPFWIQACKAYALKKMKNGVLFSEILALPVKSVTYNEYSEEEKYQDLCRYYLEAQKPEKTLEKAIETDWQDICTMITMIKNEHSVLIKK